MAFVSGGRGFLCTGGLLQRGERLALACLACLVDPGLAAWLHLPPGTAVRGVLAVIAAGTLITAVQRTFWIAGRLRPR